MVKDPGDGSQLCLCAFMILFIVHVRFLSKYKRVHTYKGIDCDTQQLIAW